MLRSVNSLLNRVSRRLSLKESILNTGRMKMPQFGLDVRAQPMFFVHLTVRAGNDQVFILVNRVGLDFRLSPRCARASTDFCSFNFARAP